MVFVDILLYVSIKTITSLVQLTYFLLKTSHRSNIRMPIVKIFILPVLLCLVQSISIEAQTDTANIRRMIARFKDDPRGPYKDIRWFCKDGTIREARDPCPGTKAGYQHASFKPEVIALAEKEHIFLGQILAGQPKEDVWDAENAHSRLKQYQLERYLRNVDNGWVNRKAQFYRGAMQDEDEIAWGIEFYQWLLADAEKVRSHFFLIRQTVKDIPHTEETNTVQIVRALSEDIAAAIPSFQEMRVKIHGSPDAEDINRVRDFRDKNKDKISGTMSPKFDQLISGLATMFKPFVVTDFDEYLRRIPAESESAKAISFFVNRYPTMDCPPEQCQLISQTALTIRRDITNPMRASARLALLDVSTKLESLLTQEFSRWKIEYLSELFEQVQCLSEASAAFGFLELWEWDHIKNSMPKYTVGDSITMNQFNSYSESARRVAEWSTGMVRTVYMPVIEEFRDFEPLATRFYDDRVRSSVLLFLGQTASRLGDEFAIKAGLENDVLGIKEQSSVH